MAATLAPVRVKAVGVAKQQLDALPRSARRRIVDALKASTDDLFTTDDVLLPTLKQPVRLFSVPGETAVVVYRVKRVPPGEEPVVVVLSVLDDAALRAISKVRAVDFLRGGPYASDARFRLALFAEVNALSMGAGRLGSGREVQS